MTKIKKEHLEGANIFAILDQIRECNKYSQEDRTGCESCVWNSNCNNKDTECSIRCNMNTKNPKVKDTLGLIEKIINYSILTNKKNFNEVEEAYLTWCAKTKRDPNHGNVWLKHANSTRN